MLWFFSDFLFLPDPTCLSVIALLHKRIRFADAVHPAANGRGTHAPDG